MKHDDIQRDEFTPKRARATSISLSGILSGNPFSGGGGGGSSGGAATGGFFGGGGKSSSTSTETNTQNIQTQAPTIFGDGSIYQTDEGAINAGADISRAAIALGRDAIAAGENINIAGLDNARSQLQDSLNFASDVVSRSAGAVADTSNLAFDFAGGVANEYNSTQRNLIDVVRDVVLGGQESNLSTLREGIAANTELAKQVSQSSQQSVNDSVVKLAAIAAIAVAVVFIFRR